MCPHPDMNWDIKNRGLLKSHCYRSIAALQCCVSFCGTTKWIGYMYTYIPSFTEHWVEFPVLYRTFSLVIHFMKIKVLIAQLCLTLRDPKDYSLPGSSVHGILQASMMEWVTISFFKGSTWPRESNKPMSLVSPALVGGFFTTSTTWNFYAHMWKLRFREVKQLAQEHAASQIYQTPYA